ncbi:MAG TPA: hypothetical protein VE684_08780, partial [Crenalkalicoccus sp.]|nr:hypothetical protein [Crenalkalicoccus sp.]
MATRRRAIVHIGTPKTGSTSIQKFLIEHRRELLAAGFCYPTSPGMRNHTALPAYGAGEGYSGNVVRRAGGSGDGGSIAARLERALAKEVGNLPEHVHTVLFSSEQLATRLDEVASVERLKQLLAPLFEEIRIVVYLRRQDEAAVSRYSTALRAGGETSFALLPPPGEEGRLYDLAAILDRYGAVFGPDAITPRIFERSRLVAGDVVRDFLEVCGIRGIEPGEQPPTRNPALRADVQELVRRFNAAVEQRALKDRPRIGVYLRDGRYHGKARQPTQAEAREFYQRFAEGNERIRARYFPDQPTLFAEDFSRYPEAEDADAVADGRVLGTAVDVLVEVAEALRSAEVEMLYLYGRQAEQAGRIGEARRNYAKAVRTERGHKRAKKGLQRLEALEAKAPEAVVEAPRHKRTPEERAAEKAARKRQRK